MEYLSKFKNISNLYQLNLCKSDTKRSMPFTATTYQTLQSSIINMQKESPLIYNFHKIFLHSASEHCLLPDVHHHPQEIFPNL